MAAGNGVASGGPSVQKRIMYDRGVVKRGKKGVSALQFCKKFACRSYVQPWLVAIGGKDGYNGGGGSGPDPPPTLPPGHKKGHDIWSQKNVTHNRPFWAALCPYMCMGGDGGDATWDTPHI